MYIAKLIYFSNKKIEELVMRDRTVQDYGLDLNDNYMSKLNGIFTLIKNDKFFFKNDIIKIQIDTGCSYD